MNANTNLNSSRSSKNNNLLFEAISVSTDPITPILLMDTESTHDICNSSSEPKPTLEPPIDSAPNEPHPRP